MIEIISIIIGVTCISIIGFLVGCTYGYGIGYTDGTIDANFKRK